MRGLARAAEAGHRKRAFGLWEGEDLVGYADDDPEITDGTVPGDVNLTYAVHARARGRGVAVAAVGLLVEKLAPTGAGRAAILRIDPDNPASLRVAEKAGSPPASGSLSPRRTATRTGPRRGWCCSGGRSPRPTTAELGT